MKPQQAIRILMLSPCYWRLNPPARKKLIEEFCASYETVSQQLIAQAKSKESLS